MILRTEEPTGIPWKPGSVPETATVLYLVGRATSGRPLLDVFAACLGKGAEGLFQVIHCYLSHLFGKTICQSIFQGWGRGEKSDVSLQNLQLHQVSRIFVPFCTF